MRFIQTTCIVMLSGVTLGVEQVPPETLVAQLLSQETSADVNEACTELRLFLRTAESTTADALRSDLCQQLSLATDHLVIRQIGRVLIAAPSDGVLSAALFRLDDATPEIRRAACDVIAGLGAFQATDPALVDAAVSKLGQVLRDESQPVHLMDSALLALSSLGPQGTNALLKLRSTAAPVKNMTNCFYSALARTGEYRVLPYLRDALSNPSVRQG